MLKDYRSNPLWPLLVEVVKSLPLYPEHKAYVRERILAEEPGIEVEKLAARMGITVGEAMVILDELRIWRSGVEEELRKPLSKPRYRKVAIGGTFNEVHYGHLILILSALRLGERVLIGVTTDEFVKTMGKRHSVRRFEDRVAGLKKVLEERGWLERCEICELRDPYGPSVEDPELEALVASPFTYHRAVEINEIRVGKGLRPLEVSVCPLVLADDGKPISSTRIALGEIYPDGKVR